MNKRLFGFLLLLLLVLSSVSWQSSAAGSPSPINSSDVEASSSLQQSNIVTMSVRAFPLHPITPREGKQTVYVLVQDQIYRPIPNVEISLIVRMPGGVEARYFVQDRTNAQGFTQYTFPYPSKDVGNAVITVSAKLGNLNAQTSTSFMIWW